jgi:hypothetical protein
LTLSIEATDQSELRYQWYIDGLLISFATNSSLTFPSIAAEDQGKYTVEVSSAVRTLTDGPVDVIVYAKPRIIPSNQFKTMAVGIGEPAYLSIVATGSDLRYEWFKESTLIARDVTFLYFPSMSIANFGYYSVKVSNLAGTVESDKKLLFPASREQLTGEIRLIDTSAEGVEFEASGLPQNTYEIQASSDLSDWQTIESVEVGFEGRFTFRVPLVTLGERWFIRTVRQRSVPPSQ